MWIWWEVNRMWCCIHIFSLTRRPLTWITPITWDHHGRRFDTVSFLSLDSFLHSKTQPKTTRTAILEVPGASDTFIFSLFALASSSRTSYFCPRSLAFRYHFFLSLAPEYGSAHPLTHNFNISGLLNLVDPFRSFHLGPTPLRITHVCIIFFSLSL